MLPKAEKDMELKSDGDIKCSSRAENGPQMPGKRPEELETRGRIENILGTALLRSVRILRRVLET